MATKPKPSTATGEVEADPGYARAGSDVQEAEPEAEVVALTEEEKAEQAKAIEEEKAKQAKAAAEPSDDEGARYMVGGQAIYLHDKHYNPGAGIELTEEEAAILNKAGLTVIDTQPAQPK